MRSIRRHCKPAAGVLLALVVLGGAGCALLVPEDERQEAHQAFLAEREELERWSVSGRAALRASGEAVSLSLRWEQAPGMYAIDLSGPFGTGAVRIVGDGQGVTLRDGTGRSMTADTPEELLAVQTGHELPVRALADWIVGRPARGLKVDDLRLDGSGRPDRLRQADWSVQFQGWEEVDGIDLPTRVDLQSGSKQLRVALSGWRVADG